MASESERMSSQAHHAEMHHCMNLATSVVLVTGGSVASGEKLGSNCELGAGVDLHAITEVSLFAHAV